MLPKNNEQKKYNDVSRPETKIVPPVISKRHGLLCSMFPDWTPLAERIVDYLLSLRDEEFRSICQQDEGGDLTISHQMLDFIGEQLKHNQTTTDVKIITLVDDDADIEAELQFHGLTD